MFFELTKTFDESEEEKVGEGFKLSNFIDTKFLEECALIADENTFLKTNKLQNLNDLLVFYFFQFFQKEY